LDKVAEEQGAKEATGGVVDVEAVRLSPPDPKQAELAEKNKAINNQHGDDTDQKDSVGKPKESGKPVQIGGRGVNAPRDSKPAPDAKQKRAAQPKITTTDKIDNAGNPKEAAPHGIRGVHTSRDTYRT
jgi:hypothetical protein